MDILLPAHYSVFSGGIATLARGLLHALPRYAGPDVHIVVPPLPPHRGALTRTATARSALARLRYEQVALAHAARRADSVHLVDARPLVASRTPFVLTVHDVSYLDHPEWYPPAVVRYKALLLRAALMRRPAAIVFDSCFGRDRLLRHHGRLAGRSRLAVIPPGLEPPPPDVAPLAATRPYFLTVGAIEPRRNHLTLLRAFRHARAQGLELDWIIAGPAGHGSEPIVAGLRGTPGVDLRGMVTQEQLERLYRGALFHATPSLAEGFGYPPLEAMARGVPVLCSRGSALDETIGDAGVRVDATDTAAWAAQLQALQDDGALRESLSAGGLEQVSRFAWRGAAEALLDLHRSIGG